MDSRSIVIVLGLLFVAGAIGGFFRFRSLDTSTSAADSSASSASLTPGDSGDTNSPVLGAQNVLKMSPSDEEDLKNMIRGTMNVFAISQKSGDFKDFYNLYSDSFKTQVTIAELREIYAKNIGTDYSFVTRWDLAFDSPPSVDEKGILTVEGTFSSSSGVLHFTFKYVRESNVWKLIGVRLQGVDK
jgi:hypothetical protein